MKKVDWKTLNISLVPGETIANKEIHLELGERIVAAVETGSEPGQIINLGLYEQNNEVSAPMALPFWKRSNAGQYLDGFKPISFKGGSSVDVRLSTKSPIANAVEIQIVFGIIKEDTTC